jgi:ribose 5-phosphate isomerase B
MKIAVGSDHRGFDIKTQIAQALGQFGHEVQDLGPHTRDNVDYPDYAFAVAGAVGAGFAERGVLVCGTGLGMCIAANKVPGIRAAPCHDLVTAELSRRHNDANVLCLSADLLSAQLIERMLHAWLQTPFEGARHARRVQKIIQFEARLHVNGRSHLPHPTGQPTPPSRTGE